MQLAFKYPPLPLPEYKEGFALIFPRSKPLLVIREGWGGYLSERIDVVYFLGNIIRKVLRACQDSRVSEKFLFINDDHIFLRKTNARAIPPFHQGDMKDFPQHYFGLNPWRKRLYLTKLALENQGLPTLHYDCHTPILFEKVKFIAAMSRFDYASRIGLTMKSLYGNIHYPQVSLLTNEKKTVFKSNALYELNLRFEKPTSFKGGFKFNKQKLRSWYCYKTVKCSFGNYRLRIRNGGPCILKSIFAL